MDMVFRLSSVMAREYTFSPGRGTPLGYRGLVRKLARSKLSEDEANNSLVIGGQEIAEQATGAPRRSCAVIRAHVPHLEGYAQVGAACVERNRQREAIADVDFLAQAQTYTP